MSIIGDRVVREGSPVRRVRMYPSRVRCGLLVLVTGLFAAGGVFLVASGGDGASDGVVGIVTIVFFGPGVVLFLWRMLSGRPVLVLDERGISHATSLVGTTFLPWVEIDRVYARRGGVGQSWIGVDVQKRSASASREGVVTRINRTLFGGSMHIMTVTLPMRIDDVLREIAAVAPDCVYVEGH